ncbi:hypothetical protein BC831DRAFT_448259 [Entophlyctis helioformis]|nr:hypothetical protein BC831DRAFT_448259 [Entophlyctis helioformis]
MAPTTAPTTASLRRLAVALWLAAPSALSLASAFSLLDCRTAVNPAQLPPPAQLPATTTPLTLTVQDCVDACSRSAAGFALLGASACRCVPTFAQVASDFIVVNTAECSLTCADGFPCGGVLAFNRFSVYNVTENGLPAPAPGSPPTAPSPSPGTNGTRPVPNANTTNENLGKGNAIDQRKIALIVVGVSVFVLAVIITGVLVYRYRKRQAIPATPTLDMGESSEFLIPGLLPRTADQIYSVHTSYKAVGTDELSLEPKQIVAVRNTFADGWAVGTDVATGADGVFPLACLVPHHVQGVRRGPQPIPPRTPASVQVAMVAPPVLRAQPQQQQQQQPVSVTAAPAQQAQHP